MRLPKGMLAPLLAIIYAISSYSVLAADYELKTGLWTGFDNFNMSYIMLDIKDNKHTFYELHIPSGFRSGKRFAFTNEDVSCNSLQCTISLDREKGYSANVVISQAFGGGDRTVAVFDTRFHSREDFLATYTYKLHKENHKSAANRFINLYRDSIDQLYSTTNDGLKGLWIGVWNMDVDNKQLVALELEHDNNGKLIRLTNNIQQNHITPIESADVVIEGKSVVITSYGKLKNSRAIATLSFRSGDNLTGLMQSKLNDLIVFEGGISLRRIKEPGRR
jgi:hypothetical protein